MCIFWKKAVKSPSVGGSAPLASGGWGLCPQTPALFSIQLIPPALTFLAFKLHLGVTKSYHIQQKLVKKMPAYFYLNK